MIKAVIRNKVVLGLSEANVEELVAGHPIVVSLGDLIEMDLDVCLSYSPDGESVLIPEGFTGVVCSIGPISLLKMRCAKMLLAMDIRCEERTVHVAVIVRPDDESMYREFRHMITEKTIVKAEGYPSGHFVSEN